MAPDTAAPELQWRIRCADDCGFIVKCQSEQQARDLAACENAHGETLVEARTVTYGEWLPGSMMRSVSVAWDADESDQEVYDRVTKGLADE